MQDNLSELVERHEKDLYRGNGKPGLTTRIQQAEDCLDVHEDRMNATDKRVEIQGKQFVTIIVLLLTILGGLVTQMVRHA